MIGGLATIEAKSQQQADYESAEKYKEFDLGGKLSRNSLSIYPREINDTDNFWFDFQTTEGKFFYYVTPHNGKRELLFDNHEMAMALAEFTREAIDAANLSFQEFKFSKDQKTFTFEYKDKIYEYNRLTRKLKELKAENDIQKKEEEVEPQNMPVLMTTGDILTEDVSPAPIYSHCMTRLRTNVIRSTIYTSTKILLIKTSHTVRLP